MLPVEAASKLPVDEILLVQEAEDAFKSTGATSTGSDELPNVEFYYGKAKKDGRTIKTGKIYWIYTTFVNGQRKRISPAKIYGRKRGISSIENCPHRGRVIQFASRSLGFKTTGSTNTGSAGDDGRFQGAEGQPPDELASR